MFTIPVYELSLTNKRKQILVICSVEFRIPTRYRKPKKKNLFIMS